tara:strand:- start:2565 stop:3245 length:681 start_codon:yes stop_codon:yes gene_type:complete
MEVKKKIKEIKETLISTAIEANRDPKEIKLLAVSKRQPTKKIIDAYKAGQRDFGESFVQEGLEKIQEIKKLDIKWHFIGHLQSNKTRAVAENFDWIHTIDNSKTIQRLNDQRPKSLRPLNICLQIKVDEEPSKFGINASELPKLVSICANLPKISLRGLMCLPAIRTGFKEQRKPFKKLKDLADVLICNGIKIDTISMGMSGDYKAAIFEGSTIVRIGTTIFGERS